jgi:hypothetical protein
MKRKEMRTHGQEAVRFEMRLGRPSFRFGFAMQMHSRHGHLDYQVSFFHYGNYRSIILTL